MLSSGGVRRHGARGFLSGDGHGPVLHQRDQYHPGLHFHQHVSQDVGAQRDWLQRTAGPAALRSDFFLETATDQFYINEINTIPGFTSISMYPKMWEHSGIGFSELLDRLLSDLISFWRRPRTSSTSTRSIPSRASLPSACIPRCGSTAGLASANCWTG